jgi:hypothetical protein
VGEGGRERAERLDIRVAVAGVAVAYREADEHEASVPVLGRALQDIGEGEANRTGAGPKGNRAGCVDKLRDAEFKPNHTQRGCIKCCFAKHSRLPADSLEGGDERNWV